MTKSEQLVELAHKYSVLRDRVFEVDNVAEQKLVLIQALYELTEKVKSSKGSDDSKSFWVNNLKKLFTGLDWIDYLGGEIQQLIRVNELLSGQNENNLKKISELENQIVNLQKELL